MNITQENPDALNATVTIQIEPADYNEPVKKVLESYRKQAKLQGFRPGKVPYSVVKKMYGKAVLAEELNKILSEKLQSHIRDNDLKLLGQPMPKDQEQVNLDLEESFKFEYEIGLAPEFEANLTDKDKFPIFKIKVDDELIDKYVRDFQRRHGDSHEVEVVSENDMIYGTFRELDKAGELKDGGVQNQSTVAIEYVENKDAQKKLIGLKKGDKAVVEPAKLSKGDADLSAMLGVPAGDLDELSKKFELEVESIHHVHPHELNTELFDKILGPGAVTTEEEFRAKIAEDLDKNLKTDSEKKLKRDIQDYLQEKLKLELPDEFLKRWLVEANSSEEKQITLEDIERDYDEYSRFLKGQLIESRIAEENSLKVEYPEIEDAARMNIRRQFESYGQQELPDDMLNNFVQNFLQNEEQVRKLYDELLEAKLITFYRNTVKLQEKEVSFDEFVKLASSKPGKGKFIDQISNLLKRK